MEEIVIETKVLDHGYIRLIETWGSDERIIEAARMSTNKSFQGWGGVDPCPECEAAGRLSEVDHLYKDWPYARSGQDCKTCHGTSKKPGDEKLLAYLYNNKHMTPFEMAGMIIEVQAPIFVFREWHRHRTQSYNELSARYTPLPDENYVPTVDRCMIVSATNKQAGKIKDADELTHERVLLWLEALEKSYTVAESVYQLGLKWGIPKELARLPVPVGRYSRMRASANLRNWLGFETLRSDMNPGAQWEIRQYGNAIGDIIRQKFPRTWHLFTS
jgi:thymidylate synthase (FAD)